MIQGHHVPLVFCVIIMFHVNRLKEQRDVLELEHQQECERLEAINLKLKSDLDNLQLELTDKQVRTYKQTGNKL